MTMMNSRMILLSCVFTLFPSFLTSTQKSYQEYLIDAKNICSEHYQKMTPQEQQMVANVVYLLYANAFIDSVIQEIYTPFARLTQQARANMADPSNLNKELVTLQLLIEDLAYVTKARFIYTEMLNFCLDHYNQNKTETADNALEALQKHAQTCLIAWAHENNQKFIDSLKTSKSIMVKGAQYIHSAANLHRGLLKGILPFEVEEENKLLAMIDIIIKSTPTLINCTESIANALDETVDEAMKIVCVGAEIYKQYYEEILVMITAESQDQNYATALFDFNGLLPEERRSALPHPAMLQEKIHTTTKFYSQQIIT